MNDLVMRNREAEYMRQQLDPRRRDVTARDVQGFEKIRPDNRLAEMGGALAQTFSSYAQLGATYLDDNIAKAEADYARAYAEAIEGYQTTDGTAVDAEEYFMDAVRVAREGYQKPITFFNTGVGYDKAFYKKSGEALGRRIAITVEKVMRDNNDFKDMNAADRMAAVNSLYQDTVASLLGNANDIEAAAAAPFVEEVKNSVVEKVAIMDEMDIIADVINNSTEDIKSRMLSTMLAGDDTVVVEGLQQSYLSLDPKITDANGSERQLMSKSERANVVYDLYRIEALKVIENGTTKANQQAIADAVLLMKDENGIPFIELFDGVEAPFQKKVWALHEELLKAASVKNAKDSKILAYDYAVRIANSPDSETRKAELDAAFMAFKEGRLEDTDFAIVYSASRQGSADFVSPHPDRTVQSGYNYRDDLVSQVDRGVLTPTAAILDLSTNGRSILSPTDYRELQNELDQKQRAYDSQQAKLGREANAKLTGTAATAIGASVTTSVNDGIFSIAFGERTGELQKVAVNTVSSMFTEDATAIMELAEEFNIPFTDVQKIVHRWTGVAESKATQRKGSDFANITGANPVQTIETARLYAATVLVYDLESALIAALPLSVKQSKEQVEEFRRRMELINMGLYKRPVKPMTADDVATRHTILGGY